MYAGQLERAIDLADGIVAAGHDIFDAHIARCCSLFALGEVDRSLAGFRELADRDVWYVDSARLGLADGLLAAGKADQAGEVLGSIQLAEEGDQRSETARLMLAEVALELGRDAEASEQLASLEASATDPRILVAVALLGVKLGASELVERISQQLKRHIDPQSRAYTLMVDGLCAQLRGDFSQAERAFKDAIAALDLWMIHSVLADFYQSLNMVLEARLERATCIGRPGEGVTAYINRMPSCRYLARMMDSG